ncbi:hypothetical protein P280DRAFT_518767 [Massarina eburnea CBS 473.64]|uniref:Uncharacterized protein n=1 Tax=Massarina eburnea CBS 473.64 TaxID=1395130 RepID=A0A6A6RZ27_9PLEO|nr:hypothetical protein P280DRAFT_518767 [Massarina eburnea CBS 473.64]
MPASEITFNISLANLPSALLSLLTNHTYLSKAPATLTLTDSLPSYPLPPTPDLHHILNALHKAHPEFNPLGIEALNADFTAGHPCAYIALILTTLLYFSNPTHLDLTQTHLHSFPMLECLFNDPLRFCLFPDPLTARLHGKQNYVPTWPLPAHWSRPYATQLFKMLGTTLQGLYLPREWSIAGVVSSPPFRTMVPIVRLPGLAGLKALRLPYHAVVPRPRGYVGVMPTSAVPGALERLVVVDAYPSSFLLDWLRAVRDERDRFHGNLVIEVRFSDVWHRRQFDVFLVEARRFGGHAVFGVDGVVMSIGLEETGDGVMRMDDGMVLVKRMGDGRDWVRALRQEKDPGVYAKGALVRMGECEVDGEGEWYERMPVKGYEWKARGFVRPFGLEN